MCVRNHWVTVLKPSQAEIDRVNRELWADPMWVLMYGQYADKPYRRKALLGLDETLASLYNEATEAEKEA